MSSGIKPGTLGPQSLALSTRPRAIATQGWFNLDIYSDNPNKK